MLKLKRGRWLGFWNVLYNIGGVLVGIVVFWGVIIFFNGGVGGMFIVLGIIVIIIVIICFFVGYDELEELGWNFVVEIFEEWEE